LTIKSISNTEHSRSTHSGFHHHERTHVYAHLVFNCQRSVKRYKKGVSWTPAGHQARPKHFADCLSKEKPEAWTGKAATYSVPYTGTASVTPATVSLERR